MNHHIPCITDSDENRFQSDPLHDATLDDDFPVMTDMEKRIEWICGEWAEAIKSDTYEAWHDLRMMLHGAVLALGYCRDRHEDRMAINDLGTMVFENSLACIQAGKYEGATK